MPESMNNNLNKNEGENQGLGNQECEKH